MKTNQILQLILICIIFPYLHARSLTRMTEPTKVYCRLQIVPAFTSC